ncbi:MAG: pyridoxal-phosphate dependent enzyme, partial [Cellvibrionaceae bacterium]|nr:pyridoxal-phosphate dependent enzyme [Cellvibrionaceae bacterium]
MPLFDLSSLEAVLPLIYQSLNPTPCRHWPLLSQLAGAKVWVKHENHNPTGAFKVRGGLVYLSRIAEHAPGLAGVVSATRGNHGQSIALAAKQQGLAALIVVPKGNSEEKNAAMAAFG